MSTQTSDLASYIEALTLLSKHAYDSSGVSMSTQEEDEEFAVEDDALVGYIYRITYKRALNFNDNVLDVVHASKCAALAVRLYKQALAESKGTS